MTSMVEAEPIQLRLDGLTSPEDRTIKNIARAIAVQQLADRDSPYLTNSGLSSERDRAWKNIASLNPDYEDIVLMLKGQMEVAKKLKDAAEGLRGDDPLHNSFLQVENEGTRAILMDILRERRYDREEQQSPRGDPNAEDYECDVYDEIISALPEKSRPTYTPFADRTYPKLEDLTPERVIELILQGKIYI